MPGSRAKAKKAKLKSKAPILKIIRKQWENSSHCPKKKGHIKASRLLSMYNSVYSWEQNTSLRRLTLTGPFELFFP